MRPGATKQLKMANKAEGSVDMNQRVIRYDTLKGRKPQNAESCTEAKEQQRRDATCPCRQPKRLFESKHIPLVSLTGT